MTNNFWLTWQSRKSLVAHSASKSFKSHFRRLHVPCIHVHALHTVWIHACSNKQSRKTSCLDLFFKFPLSSCIGVRIRVFDILHAFYQSAIRKQSGGHTWKILKGAEIAKGDRYIKQILQELPFKHTWAVKCALHHSMSNLEMSRFSLCARLRESALSCAPVRPLCGQVFLLNFAKLWTLWFEQSWG